MQYRMNSRKVCMYECAVCVYTYAYTYNQEANTHTHTWVALLTTDDIEEHTLKSDS